MGTEELTAEALVTVFAVAATVAAGAAFAICAAVAAGAICL
jgi:hypothetical protein